MARNRLSALAPILAGALIFVVLINVHGAEPADPATSTAPASVASPAQTKAPSALANSARRFLRAFLAYEVADRSRHVVDALNATATTSFVDELAASRPTDATPPTAHARLGALTLNPLAGNPPLALVTATARRPSGPEELSFLFTERGIRWLASAPGE